MNMLKDKNNDIDNNINDNNDEDNSEKNEENEDLEERKDTTTITEIGKLMAKFPVEPKLGKILNF